MGGEDGCWPSLLQVLPLSLSQSQTVLASHILPSFWHRLSPSFQLPNQPYPNSLNKVVLGIVRSPDHRGGGGTGNLQREALKKEWDIA